jgi:hypothetical protein
LTHVVLRGTSDRGGSRHLNARLAPSGDVVIEGQDLGGGVEEVFGSSLREYEWAWTIRAANVRKLAEALDTEDVLEGLRAQFSGDRSSELGSFLEKTGVPVEFWSRVGD